MTALDVLVVGAGMYVSGLGTSGFGTVIPSLAQAAKRGLVRRATIAATNPANEAAVLEKAAGIQQILGTSLPIDYSARSIDAANDRHFDCAIVSVPDDRHFDIVRTLIDRGLHVLVVKPFVPTLAEADELIALQRAKNVHGAVEFHKRFDEANLRAKRMLREGAIGDVLYALVEFSQRRTIPLAHFRDWAARTNIFQYLGVHYADMIRFCTGATPARVMATAQKRFLAAQGIDTYDAVQATIEWTSPSFVSVILTNWIDSERSSAMSDQKIKWIGTSGRIESDQKERGLVLVNDGGVQDVNPYFSDLLYDADDQLEFRGYGFDSIMQFLDDIAAIGDGRATPESLRGARATFAEARVSVAITEGANRSLERGGEWVRIDG